MDEGNERDSLSLMGTVKAVIFTGTPEECAKCEESATGRFLKPVLEKYRD